MKDGKHITKIRTGLIGNESVTFKISVNISNSHINFAQGELTSSKEIYESIIGASQSLKDTETNLDFGIFVVKDRFSFERYDNIEKLFT